MGRMIRGAEAFRTSSGFCEGRADACLVDEVKKLGGRHHLADQVPELEKFDHLHG